VGFECIYHYHERIEGEYNKEETKTFKKKVGDPFDDVPLEKLATAIMAQLARRDVWIVDVEVFELSKKPISFKEAKGGIILKNKKFLFDGGCEDSMIVVQDVVQPSSQQVDYKPSVNHVNIQGQSTQPHNMASNRRPIDWVVFSPEPHYLGEIRQKGLRMTNDKKYPVFEKRQGGLNGDIYLMVDDAGRDQLVSEKYFIPANINLIGDKELGFSESPQQRDGGNLYWGGANAEQNMPDIRRR
jgi:hypothetical protein